MRATRRQALAFALAFAGALVIAYVANPELLGSWTAGALTAGAALMCGLLVVGIREIFRDTAAAVDSIERRAGMFVLGTAPELSARELRDLPPDQRTPIGYLIHKPASNFAQSTRQLQHAISGHQIVAFIGAVPDEGATTAALCAAASATLQGLRAVVLDCDVRRRSLSRTLNASPQLGILQAAENPDIWEAVIEEEPETGMHFMPAARMQSAWQNLYDAQGFRAMLAKLRERYDLIVLDCPPALIAAEGPLIARLADACVVVMGWDTTPVRTLRETRRAFRRRGPKTPSLYVNRAPVDETPHRRGAARSRPLAYAR